MAKKGLDRKPFSAETRQRMREAALRRFSDPEQRAAHQKRQAALWQREDFIAKRKALAKPRAPVSEETRKKMSESAKRRFSDPAQREAHRKAQKALWATPKYREIAERKRAAWTPERRAAASAFVKSVCAAK